MKSLFLLPYLYQALLLIIAMLIGCPFCCFVETEQRNKDNAKQKEETALLQAEQKTLAKNVDDLNEQLYHVAMALYSGIVAAQS